MTRVLTLTLHAQVNHGDQSIKRQVKNSDIPEKVGLREEAETMSGDHLPLTTSGITTMVPKLSAETWDTPLVPELTQETTTTELHLILKPVTEDAQLV
jgi:hypothetical protein